MHRTNRVPCALWGGLLSLGLLLGDTASARAQAEVAPARPASAAFTVAVNVTKPFQMAKKQAISEVRNEKESVARISVVPNDSSTVMITGVSPGITRVTFTGVDKTVQEVDVIVQLDIDLLKNLLKRTVPTATVEPVPGAGNTIIMTGTVAKAEDVQIILGIAASVTSGGTGPAQIINAMRVGGVQQVQLDVVIARVARSETRQMFSEFVSAGNSHFLNLGLNNSFLQTFGVDTPPVVTAAGAAGGNSANLGMAFFNNRQSVIWFLQALRDNNLAKLLAEPHLVTLSGRPASFVSGGEQAVPTVSGFGGTAGVEFVPFGTRLDFLPIVLGNGKIYLEVEPEVSALDAASGIQLPGTTGASGVVPGRLLQRARTAVEMEAGQTLVIGGLVQNTVQASTRKIPIAGDLPFVGAFFSRKNYQETEEELLILVTPYLVDPLGCDQVPKYLPGQETRSPDDFELFLEGILEAPRGQREVCPDRRYVPPFRNGPTADVFPCGGGCGNGGCTSGCGPAAQHGHHHSQVVPAPSAGTVVYETPLPIQGRPVMMENTTVVVPAGAEWSPMPAIPAVTDGRGPQ